MAAYDNPRFELVLQPVSGKAMPVYKGEVLRITLIEGAQCVHFNCFNLHDYKEFMSVAHTRTAAGFRMTDSNVVMSNPNRFNPMLAILEKSETCIMDLLGPRCWSQLFQMMYHLDMHTNCQQTFAESIGEYGLTPDDVHDSLNMWMSTGWDDRGTYFPARRNPGKKGDHIDLLALMDVLAVPQVCGSGDVLVISNYWLKPVQVQIFEASRETEDLAGKYVDAFKGLKRQTVEDFHMKEIRTERELRPIAGYQPNFLNFPLGFEEISIELTDEDYTQVQGVKMRGLGVDDEDTVRSAVMEWCLRNRTFPHPQDFEAAVVDPTT